MRKLSLFFLVALVSFQTYAISTTSIGPTLLHNLTKQTNLASAKKPLAIIYGGQDFSYPKIATRTGSPWIKQSTLLG